MRRALRWTALPVALVLLVFSLRRLVLTVAALWPGGRKLQPPAADDDWPAVLIVVPARDEAGVLPGLIDSLANLDYPPDRLRVTLVDDGSTDETPVLMRQAAARYGWQAFSLGENRGKPQALNEAVRRVAFGDLVAVYDADHRPRPDALKHLAAAFEDPRVAGASGRTLPANATSSLPAYYAAVESLVHQMVTMRAKDRLNLAPALLGSNCAYRRSALSAAGGFRPGALLEDSDLTLALARLGFRLRLMAASVARHQVPESVEGYVRQHVRWARGFNDAAREHALAALRDRSLPWPMRLELALFSLGYLDRLALLAAILMKRFDRLFEFPTAVLVLSLTLPGAQTVAVLVRERAPAGMWLRLPALPLVFGLDVAVSVRAAIDSVRDRPRIWDRTRRAAV